MWFEICFQQLGKVISDTCQLQNNQMVEKKNSNDYFEQWFYGIQVSTYVASISCLLQMIWVAGRQRIFHWNHSQAEEEDSHRLPTFYFLQIHAAPEIHSFQTIIYKFSSKLYELYMLTFIEKNWGWIFKIMSNYKYLWKTYRNSSPCCFQRLRNCLQSIANKRK